MDSVIYNLLSVGLMRRWRERLEKKDSCGFGEKANKAKEELIALLDDKGKSIFDNCIYNTNEKWDEMCYELNILTLNLGVQIGLELQKAFDKFELR